MISARVQLPEPVLEEAFLHVPAGVQVKWSADRPQMMLSGTPGASIRVEPPRPTTHYKLQIDQLPPGQHVEIGIRTSLAANWGPTLGEGVWADRPGDRHTLYHFINGSFQFEYQGAVLERQMIARLEYDKKSRRMSFGPVVQELTDCSVMMGFLGGGMTISTAPIP